jgi:ribosomal protein S18 acetylase RimI-like enzyme
MDIQYEKFSEKHLNSILELEKEWIDEDITYGIVQSNEKAFVDANKDYFYLALDGAKVIGYIICEIVEKGEYNIFPKDISFLQVNDVYVTKEYRNKKIGEKLLCKIEKEAKNNGIRNIFVSSATKDSDAIIRFYKKNGYKIWTTLFFKSII